MEKVGIEMSTSPFSGRHSAGPARPSWAQRLSIEDPRRIRAFRLTYEDAAGAIAMAAAQTLRARSNAASFAGSLANRAERSETQSTTTAGAVTISRPWISGLCRVLAPRVFGSAGLLLPAAGGVRPSADPEGTGPTRLRHGWLAQPAARAARFALRWHAGRTGASW